MTYSFKNSLGNHRWVKQYFVQMVTETKPSTGVSVPPRDISLDYQTIDSSMSRCLAFTPLMIKCTVSVLYFAFVRFINQNHSRYFRLLVNCYPWGDLIAIDQGAKVRILRFVSPGDCPREDVAISGWCRWVGMFKPRRSNFHLVLDRNRSRHVGENVGSLTIPHLRSDLTALTHHH